MSTGISPQLGSIFVPDELRKVAEQVNKGEQPTCSVRTLLSWFWKSQRRGRWIVSVIRSALKELHLSTVPDFDWTYLDASVKFVPEKLDSQEVDSTSNVGSTEAKSTTTTVDLERVSIVIEDATYRIGRLSLANKIPITMGPDSSIQEAVTIMLRYDYSQLPVIRNERDIRGIVSWRSIGTRLSLGRPCSFVREALEEHSEISVDASLFDAVALLREHDCVLVRDAAKKLSGILTAYDIGVAFSDLGAPFLILSQIENHIRRFINGIFTRAELESIRNPGDSSRQIRTVADLTLGECIRLLENPEHWSRISIPIDRPTFVKDLDEVRRIRNDVMHFDPEGISDEDLTTLHQFVHFLETLEQVRSCRSGQN